MRFIGVCGGRNFDNRHLLARTMMDLGVDSFDVVVQGGANGADRLAKEWHESNNSGVAITVHANWNHQGKAAGFKRNGVIAALPLTFLVAFPGGNGTANMVALAKRRGIDVIEVQP